MENNNKELHDFIKKEIYDRSEDPNVKFEYRLLSAIYWTLYSYNLLNEVYSWKYLEPDDIHIPCPVDTYGIDYWCDNLAPVWVLCVNLFGDYGTSPRFGWIEDIDGFRRFIEIITYTPED